MYFLRAMDVTRSKALELLQTRLAGRDLYISAFSDGLEG